MLLKATQQLDLLIVDGNLAQYPWLAAAAKEAGLEVAHALDGHQALQLVSAKPARLWVANLVLPDMSGIDLLRLVKARRPTIPFYLVSNTYSAADELSARAAGAAGYLCKPVSLAWLELCRATLARQSPANPHQLSTDRVRV